MKGRVPPCTGKNPAGRGDIAAFVSGTAERVTQRGPARRARHRVARRGPARDSSVDITTATKGTGPILTCALGLMCIDGERRTVPRLSMRGIVALGLVASSIAAAARQEVPRFRSGVEVVQFTVTCARQGAPPDLGADRGDFEVLVDGKPRPIAAFAAVTLPTTGGRSTRRCDSPPRRPHEPLSREGRLVVIVMDRSIGNGAPLQAAQAIASAAIGRLGPADLAGVVYTASPGYS